MPREKQRKEIISELTTIFKAMGKDCRGARRKDVYGKIFNELAKQTKNLK